MDELELQKQEKNDTDEVRISISCGKYRLIPTRTFIFSHLLTYSYKTVHVQSYFKSLNNILKMFVTNTIHKLASFMSPT